MPPLTRTTLQRAIVAANLETLHAWLPSVQELLAQPPPSPLAVSLVASANTQQQQPQAHLRSREQQLQQQQEQQQPSPRLPPPRPLPQPARESGCVRDTRQLLHPQPRQKQQPSGSHLASVFAGSLNAAARALPDEDEYATDAKRGRAAAGSVPRHHQQQQQQNPRSRRGPPLPTEDAASRRSAFHTGREMLLKDQREKKNGCHGGGGGRQHRGAPSYDGSNKRPRPFRPPARLGANDSEAPPRSTGSGWAPNSSRGGGGAQRNSAVNNSTHGGWNVARAATYALRDAQRGPGDGGGEDDDMDPRLKALDKAIIERIEMEILNQGDPVRFEDIAGLKFAKNSIEEMVIWPIRNPEFYTGLRKLPKGLLLFGPPGTGKTLIGKAIACECNATFFSISASSLTSKWIGEGEKAVRALFAVAAVRQPSIVFIDEIDSLLCQRSSEENESSRRIKTEFLVQLDGAATKASELVLVIGATNRPDELDDAARRRFVKRLYIPLPDDETRLEHLKILLKNNKNSIKDEELSAICADTKGYSGADINNLAAEASMEPLRELMHRRKSGAAAPDSLSADHMRPISRADFIVALQRIRASVSEGDLAGYVEWNKVYGTQA